MSAVLDSEEDLRTYLITGHDLNDLGVATLQRILKFLEVSGRSKLRRKDLMIPAIEKRMQAPQQNVAAESLPVKPTAVGIEGCTNTSTIQKELISPQNTAGQSKTAIPPENLKAVLDKSFGKRHPASKVIPADECCELNLSHKVYIDDSNGTIFDAQLNLTNINKNNNKFYYLQLLVPKVDSGSLNDNCHTWARWGRVGEVGQNKFLSDKCGVSFSKALDVFQKRFKLKTGLEWADRLEDPVGEKYKYLKRSYKDSNNGGNGLPDAFKLRASEKSVQDLQPPDRQSELQEPVKRLMGLIFNQQSIDRTMADFHYDAKKVPLGELSEDTLERGYVALGVLAAAIKNDDPPAVLETLSNDYFSLIPHDFGRSRPPVFRHLSNVLKEVELLENLTGMQLAEAIMASAKAGTDTRMNVVDRQYQGLGMREITPLERDSQEFSQLQDYLEKSAGSTHNLKYRVHDIFRIEREGEADRFTKSKYANIPNSNRRLLWHGSRCSNFAAILRQGLRIAPPGAPVSGYMFGKGVYFADISTKSANYCVASTSGNVGLLLLCEVELGRPPLELIDANPKAKELAQWSGCISTLGLGSMVPAGWKDAACVSATLQGVLMPDRAPKQSGRGPNLKYNEYIVYDTAQIRLRYLIEAEMTNSH